MDQLAGSPPFQARGAIVSKLIDNIDRPAKNVGQEVMERAYGEQCERATWRRLDHKVNIAIGVGVVARN